MSSTELLFWDTVDRIRESEPRYRREAYGFVVAALGHTVQALPRERLDDPARRHLSGQELVLGVVQLARREFGLMAPAVFREWGVVAHEDIGQIVFRLVDSGELSARPEDTLEDFRSEGDLLHALAEGLEPGHARLPGERPGHPGPGAAR
jgi:uncharacterized repeat protein (TIGR04138 family)